MRKLLRYALYAALAFFFVVAVHNLIAPSQDAWFDHDMYGNNNPHHKNFFGR